MTTKIITANFTLSGEAQVGLTPVITIIELDPVVPANNTPVVVAQPLVEIGLGWYRYDFTGFLESKAYVFTIDGGSGLPVEERYKIGGNESQVDNIVDAIWNEPLTNHVTSGTTGMALNEVKANAASLLISQSTLNTLLNTVLKYHKNRTRLNVAGKTMTVYDDDGTTPLVVFNLKDSAGNPSVQEVTERIPV